MKNDPDNAGAALQMTESTFEIFHYRGCGSKRLSFHSHDFYELYIFMDGSVSYFIEDKRFDLQQGDILMVPPGQIHRLDIHGAGDNYERMILWISPSYFLQLGKNGISLSDCLSTIAESENYHYRISKANYREILMLAWKILDENKQDDFGSEFLIDALFIELFVRIGREFSFMNAKKPVNQSGSLIPTIIAYINDNYTAKIAIEDLTQRFFISKSHLLREFKKYTQCTIYEYILMKRIAHVKKLINSGVRMSEACLQSGFNDYSCFYKAFKKTNNVSPKEYLQMCRPTQ